MQSQTKFVECAYAFLQVFSYFHLLTGDKAVRRQCNQQYKECQNHAQRVQNSVFEADLDFHELDSWSSLTSLSVVAMVYQEYGVELDTQDVRNADTIEDIFNIVKERKA